MEEWHPAIGRLHLQGHNFLRMNYSPDCALFRGAASGLKDLAVSGVCGHFCGTHSATSMEQELDVLLISQDLSDACTIARFWEIERDNYIAVLDSDRFNSELDQGRAAMLGFAEPGVVFRYPFFCEPFPLDWIRWLFVSPADYHEIQACVGAECADADAEFVSAIREWFETGFFERVIAAGEGCGAELTRAGIEQTIRNRLEQENLSAATPVTGSDVPSPPGAV